jgi:hypothetical protein
MWSRNSSMRKKTRSQMSRLLLKLRETNKVKSENLPNNLLQLLINPTKLFLIFTSKKINSEKISTKEDMSLKSKMIKTDGLED